MHTGQELEPGSPFSSTPLVGPAASSGVRDTFGRTLDQARQEDQQWREEEIRRAEQTAYRVRLLEGRVGLSAAAVGVGLIALGMCATRLIHAGPLDDQRMATVVGIFLGSAAVSLSAALFLVLGRKYRSGLRRHLRNYGVMPDEPQRKARQLIVRKRSSR